jgi:heptosyltransferase-2
MRNPQPRTSLTSPEPQAILVRTPNWLGDLMLSTAFVRALLSLFPNARVDLIVRQAFASLPLPHRGRVIPYDRRPGGSGGPGRFGRALRGQGYSHLFVLPPSFSSAWMGWWSGIPWRAGYGGEGRGLLLRPALKRAAPARSRHLAAEYLDLLSPWREASAPEFRPQLDVSEEWLDRNRPPALGAGGPYVVLAPGAEFGTAKQWPVEHYAALARRLGAAGRRVIVAGLPQDRPLGETILSGVPGARNLCGETTLPQLVALLARARLVVSNDSGAMHVAAALGRPQIALFGSTNPVWTAPLNENAKLIYRAEPCSPCYARTCPLGHLRCLREIGPGQVMIEAERLLTNEGVPG